MPITKDEMWKRVEQIEDIKTSINELVGHTKGIHKEVGELSILVKGNGDPARGLFYQMADLRKDFKIHCASSELTQEAITQAVKAALPQRLNLKEASIPEKTGWFFRTFGKQVKLIVWLVAIIIFSVGASYVDYDALGKMYDLYSKVKTVKIK